MRRPGGRHRGQQPGQLARQVHQRRDPAVGERPLGAGQLGERVLVVRGLRRPGENPQRRCRGRSAGDAVAGRRRPGAPSAPRTPSCAARPPPAAVPAAPPAPDGRRGRRRSAPASPRCPRAARARAALADVTGWRRGSPRSPRRRSTRQQGGPGGRGEQSSSARPGEGAHRRRVRHGRRPRGTRTKASRAITHRPVITVPARRPHHSPAPHLPPPAPSPARAGGVVGRRWATRWTATHPATGYPLTRHATHPTTAHAAEESPG